MLEKNQQYDVLCSVNGQPSVCLPSIHNLEPSLKITTFFYLKKRISEVLAYVFYISFIWLLQPVTTKLMP